MFGKKKRFVIFVAIVCSVVVWGYVAECFAFFFEGGVVVDEIGECFYKRLVILLAFRTNS